MKTRARPGCATDPVPWKDLPPEILEKIALSRKADGAGVLVRLLQTCKSWHTSLQLAENSLWWVIGLAHFPSLRSMLHITSSCTLIPARDLYRKRLLGVRAHCRQVEPPGLGPPMTEYIFSYEVSYDGELLGEASGSYDSLAKITAQPPRALPAKGWLHALHDRLRLRAFVTRRSDLSTIMLADDGADCVPADPEHACILMKDTMVIASFFEEGTTAGFLVSIEVLGGDLCEHLSQLNNVLEMQVCASFSWYDEVDCGSLSEVGVRRYLAHYAPWP